MFAQSDSDHPIDRIRGGLMTAIGGEPADETLTLVGQQQQVIERELEAVPARAQTRGADFLQQAEKPLSNVLEALRSYGTWLTTVREGLELGDSARLTQAYEASHEILPTLSAAVEEYGAIFAAYGPYKTVPANGMDRLLVGIESGEVQPQAWKEMSDYFCGGLKQKASSIHDIHLPGKSFLIDGYEKTAEEVARLQSYDPKAKESYATLMQTLDRRLHETERLERLMSESMSGATTIPATNVLLALVGGYKETTVSKDALESALDDYSEIMDAFSETFEDSVSKPIESVLVQEEIPRTLDTLDAHFSAVEELISSLEDDDLESMDAATAKLIDTAIKIDETKNVYAAALQHENQILCPSCSRANPPENRVCEACGEALPRSADVSALASSTFSVVASQQMLEENKQMVMTENVARLFNACDDIADGNISGDEFLAEVRRAGAGLKELAEELDEVAEMLMDKKSFTDEQWTVWESQHLPQLEDVAQGFIHGMAECHQGLEKMTFFVDDADEQHLIKGVRQVWEGLGVIHRSNLSMQTYSKMLDDIMSEAAADGLITAEG